MKESNKMKHCCEDCKHFKIADHHDKRVDKLDFAKCLASQRSTKHETLHRVGKFDNKPVFDYCVAIRKEDTCDKFEAEEL